MKKLMLGLMMAFAATAAMAEGNVAEVILADGSVKGYATLKDALGAVGAAGAVFTNTVRLICNVTENVSLVNNKAAILDLNGKTLTGAVGTASVITINPGSALTLTDTSAKQTGTVTMPKGAQSPSFGGGVNNTSTFTLSGGTITGCTAKMHGGGVYNTGDGTFTMTGGTIADCTAKMHGGGVHNGSGTFSMSGGTITGCTAQNGGGVNNNGTFALSGGTITGCTAKMQGGGVCNTPDGTFTMSGGAVENAIANPGGKYPSISGGLFGKEAVGDGNFSKWIASGAKTAANPDAATTNVYPTVVRGKDNCVVMVRMEGLQSVVVSTETGAVAGYPAADYRIFEVVSNATVSLAYVPAEGRELKEEAPTKLTVDEDMVVYPVKSLGPTCEGGTIEKDKEIGWVVTPTNGATKVVIAGLPEGETVAGIRLGKFVVPSGAFDGFAEGKTEGEFSLALDPAGEVTIGTETIPVQPTIGKLSDGEEPFVVGEEDVTVKVRAIPGLRYGLWRAGTLEAPAGESAGGTVWGEPVVSVVAKDTTVTLTDGKPPEGAAFYRVVVSAW